jgi:hypothetical protein
MKFIVFSNAVEGRDDEYNEWYDKHHLPDVLSIEGVKAGKRYRFHGDNPEHRYLAIYDIEGDGPAVLAELGSKSASGEFSSTDSIDMKSVKLGFWEEI